jgi:hypothetical protein
VKSMLCESFGGLLGQAKLSKQHLILLTPGVIPDGSTIVHVPTGKRSG